LTNLLFWAKLILVAAIAAACVWGVHTYNERLRDQGRQETQVKWDAAIAAQLEKEKQDAAATIAAQAKREADASAAYNALAKRNALLAARLAAVSIDAVVTGSLRDSIRTSNGESASSSPEASTSVTGLALSDWFAEVSRLYRSCREQVAGWIEWDDRRVAP